MALSDFKFHIRTIQNNNDWNDGNCFENMEESNYRNYGSYIFTNYTNLYHNVNFGLEFQFLYKGQFFTPKLFMEHFRISRIKGKENFLNLIEKTEIDIDKYYYDIFQFLNLNDESQLIWDYNLCRVDLQSVRLPDDTFQKEHNALFLNSNTSLIKDNQIFGVSYIQYKIECIKSFDNGSINVGDVIKSNILRIRLNFRNNVFYSNITPNDNKQISWKSGTYDKLNKTTYISDSFNFPFYYYDYVIKRFTITDRLLGYKLKNNIVNEDEKIFHLNVSNYFLNDYRKIIYLTKNIDYYKNIIGNSFLNQYMDKNGNVNDIEYNSSKADEIFSQYNKDTFNFKFINKNTIDENKIILGTNHMLIPYCIGYGIMLKWENLKSYDNLELDNPIVWSFQSDLNKKIIDEFVFEKTSVDYSKYIVQKNKNLLFMVFPETIIKPEYWKDDRTDLKKQSIWRDSDMYTKTGINNKWFWTFILTDWVDDSSPDFIACYGNSIKLLKNQIPMTTYYNDNQDKIFFNLFADSGYRTYDSVVKNYKKVYQNQPTEVFDFLPLNIYWPVVEVIVTQKIWQKKENPEIKKVLYTENDELKSKIEIKIDNTKDNIIVLK